MDQVCFALPVLAGKLEEARAFFRELETQRKDAFADSAQRTNISKESWHLQQTPQGDLLLAYMECPDFPNALRKFSQSHDEFDRWFKQRLAEVTGVDLNDPPPELLSEQLSHYDDFDTYDVLKPSEEMLKRPRIQYQNPRTGEVQEQEARFAAQLAAARQIQSIADQIAEQFRIAAHQTTAQGTNNLQEVDRQQNQDRLIYERQSASQRIYEQQLASHLAYEQQLASHLASRGQFQHARPNEDAQIGEPISPFDPNFQDSVYDRYRRSRVEAQIQAQQDTALLTSEHMLRSPEEWERALQVPRDRLAERLKQIRSQMIAEQQRQQQEQLE